LTLGGVDVQSASTGYVDLGYSTTESVTVTLSDPSPSRGSPSKTASYRTEDPPPPTVNVYRGERCGARGSSDPCANSPNDEDCVNASCGRVWVEMANFTSNVNCTLTSSTGGGFGNKGPWGNGTHRSSWYYGFPNGWVQATCGGVQSNRYDWPNN
jgi:hypothetical protein